MAYDGHLYGIIFDQGTVKVGMTTMKTVVRRNEHRNMGLRFGISIAKALELKISDDLLHYERLLKWMCRRHAPLAYGEEWFRFESVAKAEKVIKELFGNIKDREEQDMLKRKRKR